MKILFSQSLYQHLLFLLCMVFVSSVRRVMAGRSTSPRSLILMTTYCCANAQLRERKRLCLFFCSSLFVLFCLSSKTVVYFLPICFSSGTLQETFGNDVDGDGDCDCDNCKLVVFVWFRQQTLRSSKVEKAKQGTAEERSASLLVPLPLENMKEGAGGRDEGASPPRHSAAEERQAKTETEGRKKTSKKKKNKKKNKKKTHKK